MKRLLNFQRITTGKQFIPQIDGLRFVAIMSVVGFHLFASLAHNGAIAAPAVDPALNSALSKRGVELFFAISGFVLALPFASSYFRGSAKVKLRQYFLRRLTRLEPPYIINLVIWTTVLAGVNHQKLRDLGPHVLASVAYLHGFIYHGPSTINGVAWSLEVEVQFYVLVPLLTCVFAISNKGARRAIIAGIMISWSAATPFFGGAAHGTILFYLPFFLAGFLVCDLELTRQNAAKNFLWDVIALIFWPVIWLMPERYGALALPPVIVLLYLAAFRGRLAPAIFSNRLLTVMGGMCYSIYLFHFLFISAMGKLTKAIHFGNNFWFYYLIQAAIIVPLVLIACAVYFVLIERPCMDREWPRKVKQFLSRGLKSQVKEKAAAETA